ncbi:MAG: GNAT family N-acetyltransferase [Bacteroidota bacterium]
MVKLSYFNPFTRITHLEKAKLVEFLRQNVENGHFSTEEILEAIECAVKERPSFGGFILTFQEEDQTVGALVVSNTGMENRNAKHRLTMLAVDKRYRHNGIPQKLIQKAAEHAGGELALQLEPGKEEVAFFENLGFKARYVEMRLG